MLRRWVAMGLGLGMVSSGCGPRIEEDDGASVGSSETSGVSESGSSGVSGSGGTGGSSPADTGESEGESGGLTCDAYASDETGPAVTVTIRNDGTVPVFFRPNGCEGAVPLEIRGPDGSPIVWWIADDCWPMLCDDFVGAPDCHLACVDCEGPSGFRLEPGGSTSVVWSGAALESLSMPMECAPGEACQRDCWRREQAAPGTYAFGLTVHRACAGECDCFQPRDAAACQLWTHPELSEPVEVVTTVEVPARDAVDLVIVD
jgi:hypothetical protein